MKKLSYIFILLAGAFVLSLAGVSVVRVKQEVEAQIVEAETTIFTIEIANSDLAYFDAMYHGRVEDGVKLYSQEEWARLKIEDYVADILAAGVKKEVETNVKQTIQTTIEALDYKVLIKQ